MDKSGVIKELEATGVVAVVRAESIEEAVAIADACADGGVRALEITFTVPGADKVIQALAKKGGDILLGAGTVLDSETARIAILAGAQYIVGPNFNAETAKLCNRYQIPYFPGCGTINEMVEAMEAGCEILKLFPGNAYNPSYIKAVAGPLPQAKVMPTGGVDLDNAADWIRSGAVAIGIGGKLTAPAKTGNYAGVTELARKFKAAVDAAREA